MLFKNVLSVIMIVVLFAMIGCEKEENGAVTFRLSENTPPSISVPTGAGNFVMTAIDVTNDGMLQKITRIKIRRFGVSADVGFKAKILDEKNNRHGETTFFGGSYATINLSSDPIELPTGKTTIYIAIDVASSAEGTVSICVESQDDISTNADVCGEFPIRGNEFSVINGVNLLGTVKTENVGNFNQNLKIGESHQIITQFKMSEITNEPVIVKNLVLTNIGSGTSANIGDFVLINENTRNVLGTATLNEKKQLVFNNTQILLEENTNTSFSILAFIKAGAGETIQLVIKQRDDISLYGKETGISFLQKDVPFPIGSSLHMITE